MNKKVDIDPDSQSLEPKSDGSGAFNAASQVEQQPRDRTSDYDMGKLLSLLDKLDIPGSERKKREIKGLVQAAANLAEGIETTANYYLEIERRYEELEQAIEEANIRTQIAEEENARLKRRLAVEGARAEEAEARARLAEGQVEEAEARADIAEGEKEKLEELSETDSLTGLYNRRGLEKFYSYKVAEIKRIDDGRANPRMYFLLIDLDNFKQVNDHYGHAAGDKVLIAVADVLKGFVRQTECAFRLGGDEMGILLVSENGEDLNRKEAIKRLNKSFKKIDVVGDDYHIPSIEASIGIREVDVNLDMQDNIKIADERMYEIKYGKKEQGNAMILPTLTPEI